MQAIQVIQSLHIKELYSYGCNDLSINLFCHHHAVEWNGDLHNACYIGGWPV